jgi:hypothetical protein
MDQSRSELMHKSREAVAPASRCDNVVAAGGEASHDRRAEAGGSACDENLHIQSPNARF